MLPFEWTRKDWKVQSVKVAAFIQYMRVILSNAIKAFDFYSRLHRINRSNSFVLAFFQSVSRNRNSPNKKRGKATFALVFITSLKTWFAFFRYTRKLSEETVISLHEKKTHSEGLLRSRLFGELENYSCVLFNKRG